MSGLTSAAIPGTPTWNLASGGTTGILNISFASSVDPSVVNAVDTLFAIQLVQGNGTAGYLKGDGTLLPSLTPTAYRTLADWNNGHNHFDSIVLDSTYTVTVAAQQVSASFCAESGVVKRRYL